MLDHPVTQKVLATVAAAGIVFVGGTSWSVANRVNLHDQKISSIEKTQDTAIKELREEMKSVGKDVAEIKVGVAVLNEHATHAESAGQSGT